MPRFLLVVTILSYALTSIALSTDVPESSSAAQPAPANAGPVYVKIIWPVDPATPGIERDGPVIESWIAKDIVENGRQANFRAVTAWVPLVEDPFETTNLWDGKLDGVHRACMVGADMIERKDGRIKISFGWWGAGGQEATVTLKDEPGSREVVPVIQAKTKHGVPHVAIFIGVPVK